MVWFQGPVCISKYRNPCSTLQCPTHSCRNPAGIQSFLWNSCGIPVESTGIHRNDWNSTGIPQESTGIPQEFHRNDWIPLEFHWNRTGIKQNSVEKPYLNASICKFTLIYTSTHFSLLLFSKFTLIYTSLHFSLLLFSYPHYLELLHLNLSFPPHLPLLSSSLVCGGHTLYGRITWCVKTS